MHAPRARSASKCVRRYPRQYVRDIPNHLLALRARNAARNAPKPLACAPCSDDAHTSSTQRKQVCSTLSSAVCATSRTTCLRCVLEIRVRPRTTCLRWVLELRPIRRARGPRAHLGRTVMWITRNSGPRLGTRAACPTVAVCGRSSERGTWLNCRSRTSRRPGGA
jgi:hypothetical protein